MASITFESFIKQQAIEIPAIQRDYVQGRGCTIEEQDKREAFVEKLINAISNADPNPCHLEFIYGSVNETSHCFIPLDGQQRLTTLFLLHWVVWNKSSESARKQYPLSLISGLRYETRISSRNFCECIINRALLPKESTERLGDVLKKQPWFSEDWNYDPTIQAMISMIGFVEKKLSSFSEDEISAMLERIGGDDNPINFDILNMTEYDLTDSLYIKMNARGKKLTSFENWKSNFIQFLDTKFGNEEYEQADKARRIQTYTYKDYFCYSIEHQWTDLFWNYLKEDYLKLSEEQRQKQYPCIDGMFMNLFEFLCAYCYYKKQGSSDKEEYEKLSAAQKREIWQEKEFVDLLFGALDSMCRIDHQKFFDELFYISDQELPTDNEDCKVRLFRTKQCNLFKLCVESGTSMELTDMLLFHALLHYCVKNVTTTVDDSLKTYMRNVRNYFEGVIQNLKSNTTVQLNLRKSEFERYDNKINLLADNGYSSCSVSGCIIDDCSITHGNTEVFKKSIEEFGEERVVEALKTFCKASQIERIRVLISCGFKGTYLGDCMGRKRYFFGNTDRWDVLFISDKEQLSGCLERYTALIAEGKGNDEIIADAITKHKKGFLYYMLNYDDFVEANESKHHFAIRGDLDEVDWIALKSYSSNPGVAYHTDPLAFTVEKRLVKNNPNMQLALYKQYSGKCPLCIVKDKVHWEHLFSVTSRKDGWHVIDGKELLTKEILTFFGIDDSKGNVCVVASDENRDMVQVCVDLFEKVENQIGNQVQSNSIRNTVAQQMIDT